MTDSSPRVKYTEYWYYYSSGQAVGFFFLLLPLLRPIRRLSMMHKKNEYLVMKKRDSGG
jgi:hypothetical protein